ncbi:Nitrate reductase molybdenum cofactor assembly chaperone NarJ [Pseudovibrio axinellae]|uniref:Nitrate reductase molybdenum cofactor assembly chaperone NarJ n=1 Tax=Pseudovibrio axinellae TaxID=989403 RepID=A0A165YX84_9HYPH|nr:nitrate reductase molybdenum cofactor assembly chaperone [Pseudovibrio axinellae]KZL19317.1 Nitrate reductase molybdenum cofactor assembly chaperone NarJ [Pseudovibrio axinellae]SEQ41618.1 respiratory nitrate reductase chaperone NarJ [Pseudovibrio axinellae]
MIVSLKVLSLLLSYPTQALLEDLPALKHAVEKDRLLKAKAQRLLGSLCDDLISMDLYEAQERYVYLFDRTRSHSLHLFEHVHGESRDRGQALVDLRDMYLNHGFAVETTELPDFIPLFLEYLAHQSFPEVQELLGQTAHIFEALRLRLKKKGSIYANAFAAVSEISKAQPSQELLSEILAEPEDDPNDLEAMDRIWQEEAVRFGGNAGENSCGPDRLRMQMRAADRRPTDTKTQNMQEEN